MAQVERRFRHAKSHTTFLRRHDPAGDDPISRSRSYGWGSMMRKSGAGRTLPQRREGLDATEARAPEVDERGELGRVCAALASSLTEARPRPLGELLDEALGQVVACTRASDGSRRLSPLFDHVLDRDGARLAAALRGHPEVRVSDARAAASVVIHAMESLVRRCADLSGARARAEARGEAARMLARFLSIG
jgi:hypothetical protein